MPSIQAQKCVPVISSWVRYFILTCDNKLAVQFYDSHHPYHPKKAHPRPDVCCYYPNTNAEYFNLALAWGSPGKFVHHFLYRKMPYLLVKAPCPPAGCGVATDCCPGGVPAGLVATFGGALASLGSVPINYDTNFQAWNSAFLTTCGVGQSLVSLKCPAGQGQWTLTLGTFASCTDPATSCSPFLFSGGGTVAQGPCVGSWTVTVTP